MDCRFVFGGQKLKVPDLAKTHWEDYMLYFGVKISDKLKVIPHFSGAKTFQDSDQQFSVKCCG